MTVFHWVRHGPTHQKTFVGWRDVPADLSDTDQITRVDAFLPKDAVIVSSDLRRSVDTASALQGDRQRLTNMPGLRELNFGAWDGMAFDAISSRWDDLCRAYWETPGDVAPPGGESWNTAAARVSAAVDHLARLSFGHVIVVAHIGVILTQVQRAKNSTAAEAIGHKIDNISITEIDWTPPRARVVRINHAP